MNEIKHGILLKKARKFFEQYPDRSSAILKMKVGNIDTHWNVQRQKGQLQITEINSSKNSFLIKEDETNAGKPKKPFLYDPDQKSGGVKPKDNPFVVGHTLPASRPGMRDKHQHAVQKSIQTNPRPGLPTGHQSKTSPGYQAANMKMASVMSAAGKTDPRDPETIKKAVKHLSDQEFQDFYGGSKQALLKPQASGTRRGQPFSRSHPARVKKAGMQQYPPERAKAFGETQKHPSKKVIKEASLAFSKISVAYVEYMIKQNDHIAQSNMNNTYNREKPKLTDPKEIEQADLIAKQIGLGELTSKIDASTKQTPLAPTQAQKALKAPVVARHPGQLNQGVERKYRVVLREADGDIKGIDHAGDVEQPDGEVPAEQPPAEPQQTSEEKAIGKLVGQTIKGASFESDVDTGILSLELAGTHQPATLEWNKGGRTVFTFKGQKFVLKK
ncbi:MAG: hypothetical protein Q8Q92_03450 [bacterium]|nr:hypothetical protein [bacterium]